MVGFLVSAAINALVLSVIPWVKHKGYGACFLVAVLMAVVVRVLAVFALPFFMGLVLLSMVPILGTLTGPLLMLLLGWLIISAGLYAADQMVDDFKLESFGDTMAAAFVLALANAVLGHLVR